MANAHKTEVGFGLGWAAAVGVSFIAVALVGLALVPVYLERGHHELQARLELLDQIQPPDSTENLGVPALRGLRVVQSQMASRVRQYAQTENPFYRESYAALLRQQRQLMLEIGGWSPVLPDPTRLADLNRLVLEWQVSHHGGLMGVGTVSDASGAGIATLTPPEFRPRLAEDERRYQAVRRAVIELETTLTEEALVARRRLQFRESLQAGLTVASVLLAVIGLMVLIGLTRHFRILAQREASRRHEAVTARREVRSVLEATTDGVLGLDLQGRCTFVNTAGARLLGYEKRELKGRGIHDFIHHTTEAGVATDEAQCPVSIATKTGEAARSLDEVLWRADGTHFPAQLAAMPMTNGREVVGAVLTFTDLTEVRRAELALQDAVMARDEVLAVVSHDLRNPVGTIGAASELLLDIPVSEAQRREHLSIIHRSAERMGRLIQDLLDVARIESGGFSVHRESVDLVSVAREAVEELLAAARDRDVELVGPAAHCEEIIVDVDRYRILQLLSNLIGNAIKFTPSGGVVTLELDMTRGDVWLSVTDTGPGIPAESVRKLFDRFWKGHRGDRKGAGLGLAIVKGIAGAHGGEVLVESEVGKGTRFSVRLPVISDSSATPEPKSTGAEARPDPS
jgi:PAS domain S-box-containing protein